jgi:hypothetical protein
MPAFAYDDAISDVASGSLVLATDTLKLMLVTSSYVAAKSDSVIGSGAGTPGGSEIVATGYTGGFGGAGRKSAPRTIVKDATNNIIRVVFSGNATWTAIGGASNATIAAAVLVKEITSDAASRLVAYLPLASSLTTNGSDITLTVDGTNGNITFTL